MKKIVLLVVFIGLFGVSFSQKSALELLESKIGYTMKYEIPKYSYFKAGRYWFLKIIDVKTKEDALLVSGEFTYWYIPRNTDATRTDKFEATVKQVLDDFVVTKIIYKSRVDGKWYRLFPANKFDNN